MKFPISLNGLQRKLLTKLPKEKIFSKSLGLEANTRPFATVGHVTYNF